MLYIPKEATIVVQSILGAGGDVLLNDLYGKARGDQRLRPCADIDGGKSVVLKEDIFS